MFGSSRKSATGIHVAGRAVHIVELSRTRTETVLEHALRLELTESLQPFQLAEPARRDELAAALAAARRDFGVTFSTAYYALEGQAVLLARRPVVPGDEGASRDLLRWEAEQALADDLSEYVVDILMTHQHGFVVAAHRAALDLVAQALGQARVDKPGFDVVAFALCNALELSGALSGEGVEILLHLAAREATLIAVCDGELEDVEICPLGGPGQAAAAAGANGDEGLFGEDPAPDSVAGTPPQIVEEAIEHMARDQGLDGWPDRLWLTGAADGEWAGALAGGGVRPQVLDALAGMRRASDAVEIESPVSPGTLAVAAGLAFRGLAED